MRTTAITTAVLCLFGGFIACTDGDAMQFDASDDAELDDERDKRPTPNGSPAADAAVSVDAGPPVVPPRPTLSTSLYSEALCRNLLGCDLTISLTRLQALDDLAGCIEAKDHELALQLARPGVRVTQSQLDACTAKRRSSACRAQIEECDFVGRLSEGSPCNDSGQCASGYCRRSSDACGVCAPRVAAGKSCESGRCAAGLVCDWTTKLCAAPRAAGEACDSRADCRADLVCANGKCQTPSPEGTCSSNDDCADGLRCLESKCTEPVRRTATAGETCTPLGTMYPDGGSVQTIDRVTCRGGYCDRATSKCIGFRGVDETCDGPGSCRPSLDCKDGRCRVREVVECQ